LRDLYERANLYIGVIQFGTEKQWIIASPHDDDCTATADTLELGIALFAKKLFEPPNP
jgi:hypothetical protein